MSGAQFSEDLAQTVSPDDKLSLRLAVEVVFAVAVDDGKTQRRRTVFRPSTALVASRFGPETDSKALASYVYDSVTVAGPGALVASKKTVAVEYVVALVPASERRSVVRQLVQVPGRYGRVRAETRRGKTPIHPCNFSSSAVNKGAGLERLLRKYSLAGEEL